MMVMKMWKLVPIVLACGAVGLASAAQPAPATKTAAAKPDAMKADAAKAAAAKKGADLQAMAQDRAVANYKKNKGMGTVVKK